MRVRAAVPADLEGLAALRHTLWPDGPLEEHREELAEILEGRVPGVLPLAELVAEDGDGALAGFVEVALRSYADGCDRRRPVGY